MQSLDLDVLQHVLAWKGEGRRAWLVTVAQTFGASPRPPGSLMAMRDDGIVVGSVSGGCIEDDLVARRAEYAGRKPAFASYGVTSEEARRFGLPCGGTLEVIVEADVAVPDVEALLARIRAGEIVARRVDLATGAWSLERGEPSQECVRTPESFVSVHGPRWRMLRDRRLRDFALPCRGRGDAGLPGLRLRPARGIPHRLARRGNPVDRRHARRCGARVSRRSRTP